MEGKKVSESMDPLTSHAPAGCKSCGQHPWWGYYEIDRQRHRNRDQNQ